HVNEVTSAVFSPDGSRLASGSRDGTVKVWDATTSPEYRTFSLAGVHRLLLSPDGKRMAGVISKENAVKVFDARTGQETFTLKAHTAGVNSVAFSADSKRLASASADKTVKVWDTQTGQGLLTL